MLLRNLSAIVGAVVLASSCSPSDTAAPTATTTPAEATTIALTTTTREPSSTTVAASSTTSVPEATTTTLSHELGVWAAPADGQWFNELPIPWVYFVETPIDEPGVPGSLGWTREEAIVTVNGHPTDSKPLENWAYQHGQVWQWRPVNGAGDPHDFEPGTHSVVFEATFEDGAITRQSRTFHYEPTLEASMGWLVDVNRDAMTMTIAFARYGTIDPQIGTWAGFLSEATSVSTLPVAPEAAFILLDVNSSGQPPPSTIGFEEFVRLLGASEEGCPPSDEPSKNPCFFASDAVFVSPADEPGYPFIIYITEEDEIRQVEQIWGE